VRRAVFPSTATTASILAANVATNRAKQTSKARIEQPEQARESIVAGNPARQPQKPAQKRLLGLAEQGHVDAGLGPAQGRAQRDQQDLQQIMPLRIARPRIVETRKARPKPLHAILRK
jgi:hypothetical protein